MVEVKLVTCYIAAILCLAVVSATSEKQIKLEDIEKDTLKAAQQAKIDKQIQEQQQQQQLQYQQYGSQQGVAYQYPTSYLQYVVPQQYISQTHSQYIPLTDYSTLTSKALGLGYTSPSGYTYQTYFAPQFASIPSFTGYEGITNPYVTFTAPLDGGLQQQYYQGSLQYYPTQPEQATQYYYTPQVNSQSSSAQYSSAAAYPAPQQYVTSYQQASGASKQAAAPAYSQYSSSAPAYNQYSSSAAQSYSSSASQPYSSQTYTSQQGQGAAYGSNSYSSNQVYANTESPYMLAKGPKTVVSSSALKSQYSQTYSTTLSPLQMKYLNSPQYLAQNYNTIQSSQIYSKGSAFPGVKSTVSPPLKSSLVGAGSNAALISASQSSGSSSGAYLNNYSSASNHSPLIQPYKNLAIRNYSI